MRTRSSLATAFKVFYETQVMDVRRYGKRPDLLVFDAGTAVPESISHLPPAERDGWIAKARAAFEVRSSKFKALHYMQVKAQRKRGGTNASIGKLSPSFTVKVEDLTILYRWIERHRLQQAYVQVFFDSCFAIDVMRILRLINEWPKGMAIEKPRNSQGKPTILIPVTCGTQVGTMRVPPEFSAQVRETQLGRVDAFVVPRGGVLDLDRTALDACLHVD